MKNIIFFLIVSGLIAALPSINKLVLAILFPRISSIFFIYTGVLFINAFYIQSIGSSIDIYSGLFQVNTTTILSLIPLIPSMELTKTNPSLASLKAQEFHKKSGLKDLILKVYDFGENGSLNSIITKFYNEELNLNNRYFLLLKVRLGTYGWRTFHHGIITSKSYLDNYIEYINSQLNIAIEEYKDDELYEKVAFHYFVIPKSRWSQFPEGKWTHVARKPSQTIKIADFHSKYNIPLNNKYEIWGELVFSSSQIMIIEGRSNYTINIDSELNINSIFIGDIKFTDHSLEFENGRYFKRIFKDYTFYIDSIEQKVVFSINKIKTEFLTKTTDNPYNQDPVSVQMRKLEIFLNPKIGTFDIETIVQDGIHSAYLYSFFDGNKSYSFLAERPGDIEPCLAMLRGMLKQKYNAYTFYAHNFSGFDINFILSALSILNNEGYRVKFMKNNDKYINISITHKEKRVSINLRDSLNILPMGLKDLGIQFNVLTNKVVEPVYNNPTDITNPFQMKDLSHYNKEVLLISDFEIWKYKVIKYCETDCVSLYEIMTEFRDLVFHKWDLFVENYPTTASLSFGIFRRHYLEDGVIPIYKGKVFDFLRASFTGGSTEMYRPYGRNINCYDANSLYPSVMADNKFPVGQTLEFVGDIEILFKLDGEIWNKDNSYFIADASVETIKDLYQPYLQINHLGKEHGFLENRTIAPNGTFNMKINSSEYYNAIERGDYKINISQGYLWFSKAIFNEFVNDIYTLRSIYPKADPMNLICKYILNSLFGRFALRPIVSKTEFVPRYLNIWEFLDKNEPEDWIEIDKENILLTYRSKNEEGVDIEYNNSIAIASAVTAYARVFMSRFKNNPAFILLYSDTDSAFIEGILPKEMIGPLLGQFKLENNFKEIVFLGPKIYSGITNTGKLITKIKGYKNAKDLSFDQIKSLLHKDSNLELNHVKWYRTLDKIEMKSNPYSLSATMNKRVSIYENGIAIETKAFTLKNNIKTF